jgi:hypothetical protein
LKVRLKPLPVTVSVGHSRRTRKYLTVREFCEQYAIGRQKAYDLINSGALVTALVDGTMRRISVDSAEALFQSSHHAPTRPGPMTGKMGVRARKKGRT